MSGRYLVRTAGPSQRGPSITVRVDVDRFYPQDRISIAVTRLLAGTAHAIAEVTSDECLDLNSRRVTASITYRNGDTELIPSDEVIFEATRGRRVGYAAFTLTLGVPA